MFMPYLETAVAPPRSATDLPLGVRVPLADSERGLSVFCPSRDKNLHVNMQFPGNDESIARLNTATRRNITGVVKRMRNAGWDVSAIAPSAVIGRYQWATHTFPGTGVARFLIDATNRIRNRRLENSKGDTPEVVFVPYLEKLPIWSTPDVLAAGFDRTVYPTGLFGEIAEHGPGVGVHLITVYQRSHDLVGQPDFGTAKKTRTQIEFNDNGCFVIDCFHPSSRDPFVSSRVERLHPANAGWY